MICCRTLFSTCRIVVRVQSCVEGFCLLIRRSPAQLGWWEPLAARPVSARTGLAIGRRARRLYAYEMRAKGFPTHLACGPPPARVHAPSSGLSRIFETAAQD